jgi:hypothetical protein
LALAGGKSKSAFFCSALSLAVQLICPTGAVGKFLSSLAHGNILLFRNSDFPYSARIPLRHEGRIAIVTNVERNAVAARVLTDEQH